MSDILTGTPPDLTYLHPLVRQAWMAVWAVASGALVVILGWMGLSLIMQQHLGGQQAGWRELIPRLVLGLVAAASSLWWCALVIDVAHAISGFIAAEMNVNPGDLLRAPLDTFLTAVGVIQQAQGHGEVRGLLRQGRFSLLTGGPLFPGSGRPGPGGTSTPACRRTPITRCTSWSRWQTS